MTKWVWKPSDPLRMVDSGRAPFRETRFCETYFAKCFSKSCFDRFAPAAVNTTDFAFVAGSEMYSFRCKTT